MKAEDIEAVARIAADFSRSGAPSLRHLLRSREYRAKRRQLSASKLEQLFHEQPAFVEDWLAYCADKRTSSGWWIRQVAGSWEVGTRTNVDSSDAFSSRERATAEFLLRELDYWASLEDSRDSEP